ncbi:hypothetical protein DY000_02064398 [Brassica cretica]|uniref:Uncharacterized protein n=1 Tax=Brassica cretica TaxID=69181 RepID=A0ABQ7A458_BRACR|nr:hypothetical protein DY000_02064398 [Brassica cretica]
MMEERHHLNGMNSRNNLGTMDDLKSRNSSLYENKQESMERLLVLVKSEVDQWFLLNTTQEPNSCTNSGYHGIIEATAKSEQWPQSIFGTNYFA